MSANTEAPTKGRATRKRSATPLPVVTTRPSHAYGAQGKAELRSQVRGGGNDFASVFATGRATSTRGPATTRSVSVRSESPDPVPVATSTIPPTAVEAVAEYAGGTGGTRRPEIAPQRPAGLSLVHYLAFGLLVLLSIFSTYLSTVIPLPPRFRAARHNVAEGFKQAFGTEPYNVPPLHMEQMWFRFLHDQIFLRDLPDHNVPEMQWAINVNFLSRFEALHHRVTALESAMRLTNDTLAEIRRVIPDSVVLRRVDGHYEIPQDIWMALRERMVENSDLAPQFRAWLLRNEAEIQRLQLEFAGSVFERALETRQIVTREVFLQAMQKNNDRVAENYSEELKVMWQYNMANMQALAADTMAEALDRSPISEYARSQIEILTRANEIHNLHEALHSVNFFSVGGGARVDPSITSPTARKTMSGWFSNFWANNSPTMPFTRAPIEALTRWEEATECWCGSPMWTDGPVNIGVLMAHTINPERLTIEHIPATGTLEIGSAPRLIEVWADVGSATEAAKFDEIAAENAQGSLDESCGPKPKPEFVCIGKHTYDIHMYNHVQSFSLRSHASQFDLATNRIVVRVLANWGADHTCIYRLRMMGRVVGGPSSMNDA